VQLLDPSGAFGDDSAVSVNADGSAVVGNYYYGGAFLWTSAGGMQDLGRLPGQGGSVAADLSADGTTAVGNSYTWTTSTGYTFQHAFRHTSALGMQDLGVLPGYDFSWATGVSGDGSVVVGECSTWVGGYSTRPFLWTRTLGMVDLESHLPTLGVDLTGWTLGDVLGISADGSSIFGFGSDGGVPSGWVVTGLVPASWSNYGSGFPGTLGVPTLTSAVDPAIGTTFTADVGNSATVATIAALLVGDTPATIPLKKGGDLLLVPQIIVILPLPVGGMAVDADIDGDPALCGVEFFAQSLIVDPGAAKGQSASAGLKMVLGY
jgi:uncharacterized membrane protein